MTKNSNSEICFYFDARKTMSDSDDARWAALQAWAKNLPDGVVAWPDKQAALATYEVGASGVLQQRRGASVGNCMQCVKAALLRRPRGVAIGMIIAGSKSALFHAAILEAPAPCTDCSARHWRCRRCAVDVVVVTETAGLRRICPLHVYLRDNTVIEAVRAAVPGSFAGFPQLADALCAAWGKASPY